MQDELSARQRHNKQHLVSKNQIDDAMSVVDETSRRQSGDSALGGLCDPTRDWSREMLCTRCTLFADDRADWTHVDAPDATT